jgi:hypothetical protein
MTVTRENKAVPALMKEIEVPRYIWTIIQEWFTERKRLKDENTKSAFWAKLENRLSEFDQELPGHHRPAFHPAERPILHVKSDPIVRTSPHSENRPLMPDPALRGVPIPSPVLRPLPSTIESARAEIQKPSPAPTPGPIPSPAQLPRPSNTTTEPARAVIQNSSPAPTPGPSNRTTVPAKKLVAPRSPQYINRFAPLQKEGDEEDAEGFEDEYPAELQPKGKGKEKEVVVLPVPTIRKKLPVPKPLEPIIKVQRAPAPAPTNPPGPMQEKKRPDPQTNGRLRNPACKRCLRLQRTCYEQARGGSACVCCAKSKMKCEGPEDGTEANVVKGSAKSTPAQQAVETSAPGPSPSLTQGPAAKKSTTPAQQAVETSGPGPSPALTQGPAATTPAQQAFETSAPGPSPLTQGPAAKKSTKSTPAQKGFETSAPGPAAELSQPAPTVPSKRPAPTAELSENPAPKRPAPRKRAPKKKSAAPSHSIREPSGSKKAAEDLSGSQYMDSSEEDVQENRLPKRRKQSDFQAYYGKISSNFIHHLILIFVDIRLDKMETKVLWTTGVIDNCGPGIDRLIMNEDDYDNAVKEVKELRNWVTQRERDDEEIDNDYIRMKKKVSAQEKMIKSLEAQLKRTNDRIDQLLLGSKIPAVARSRKSKTII